MCFRKVSIQISAAINEKCIFSYSSVNIRDNGTERVSTSWGSKKTIKPFLEWSGVCQKKIVCKLAPPLPKNAYLFVVRSISQMTAQRRCLHPCLKDIFGVNLCVAVKNSTQISVAITEKLIPFHMSLNSSILENWTLKKRFWGLVNTIKIS